MRRFLRIFFLLSPCLAGLALVLFTPPSESRRHPVPSTQPSRVAGYRFAGRTMGCDWSLELHRLPSGQTPEHFRAAVQRILDEADQQMSTWHMESGLSRFNDAQTTEWQSVPADLARVVKEALDLSRLTGGAFDPTVGPVVNLWGFGPNHPAGPFGAIPTDDQIAASIQRIGYRQLHVRLDPPALRKDRPDLLVDLSAFGKGDAADRVGRWLESLDVRDYLMSVAGENRARGRSTTGDPWVIGLESPDGTSILRSIDLRDQSIATSGVGRNQFERAGRQFSHLIDPHTGRPIDSDILSVAVLDPSAAHASVLALSIAVMGAGEGLAFAERHRLAATIISGKTNRFEQVASSSWPGAYNSSDGHGTDQNPPVGRPD